MTEQRVEHQSVTRTGGWVAYLSFAYFFAGVGLTLAALAFVLGNGYSVSIERMLAVVAVTVWAAVAAGFAAYRMEASR